MINKVLENCLKHPLTSEIFPNGLESSWNVIKINLNIHKSLWIFRKYLSIFLNGITSPGIILESSENIIDSYWDFWNIPTNYQNIFEYPWNFRINPNLPIKILLNSLKSIYLNVLEPPETIFESLWMSWNMFKSLWKNILQSFEWPETSLKFTCPCLFKSPENILNSHESILTILHNILTLLNVSLII